MDDLSRRFRALGEAAAEVSDRASEGAGRAAIDRTRRALLAPEPVRRAGLSGRAIAIVAAACGAILAIAVWLASAPRALTYVVIASESPSLSAEEASRPGVVGEWVAAGADAPLSLRFSDASALALAPEARARVTTTGPRGADVLIERGTVHAAIAHADRSCRWALSAGPFEVRVTGTVFDASWDPMSEVFEIVMHEGSVQIKGPLIPPDRAVVAGERLRVSVRDGHMDLSAGPRVESPTPPVTTADPRSASTAVPPVPTVATADPAPAPKRADQPYPSTRPVSMGGDPPARSIQPVMEPPPASPSWRALAAAGKYREALAAAEVAGFEHEIARASSADLLLLADAARLGQSPARARAALMAARDRGVRGHTTFLLGKIAADQGGSMADALRWLETYLVEEPRGAFAEQALGRIVELSRRDPDAAPRAASRYLAKHPDGPHAALARSLLASPTGPAGPRPPGRAP